jgi:hypothetical protein
MKRAVALACLLSCTSCARGPTTPATDGTLPGATHLPPQRDPGPGATPLPPSVVRGLVNSVEGVVSQPTQASHASIVAAVRALADVIGALPRAEPGTEAMRSAADSLARSPAPSLAHADLTWNALQWAVAALSRAQVPDARKDSHADAVARLRTAVQRIDPDTQLGQQHAQVERAFRAAADAALIAHGLSPAFAARGDIAWRRFAEKVDEAAAAVESLARAQPSGLEVAAAGALASFSRALEAAPGIDSSLPAEVRLATTVEKGLTATLDGVAALRRGDPWLEPWMSRARRAVKALAEETAPGLPCAAVQDAFRATIDVLTIAALATPS